ncbi:MAG: hypothetical protein V1756_01355 [Patescibacteria group bacterium]
MAKEVDGIITQTSDENPWVKGESFDGNAKSSRVVILFANGTTKEVFRGKEFSEQKWKEKMEKRGEMPFQNMLKFPEKTGILARLKTMFCSSL